jgi:hypothetical protein
MFKLGVVIAVVAAVCLMVPLAFGAKWSQTAKDEKSTGNLYSDAIYANCDIRELKANFARGKLKVQTVMRGKANEFAVMLNVNTAGDKRSDPEFVVAGDGTITKTGGVDDFGNYEKPKQVSGQANVTRKKGGKKVTISVPVKKVGDKKNTGYQAQTCGEGAVDVAPGGHHFRDKNYQGRPEYSFKSIRTR